MTQNGVWLQAFKSMMKKSGDTPFKAAPLVKHQAGGRPQTNISSGQLMEELAASLKEIREQVFKHGRETEGQQVRSVDTATPGTRQSRHMRHEETRTDQGWLSEKHYDISVSEAMLQVLRYGNKSLKEKCGGL